MTPLDQLKSILPEKYLSEDGEEYQIELEPGLTEDQINSLNGRLPYGKIPNDVRELLTFSSGFIFSGLEDITFDGVGEFGFEEMFPNSVQLAGDGYGNFWIMDILSDGTWGDVFYVCHDPAVVVKHSTSLTEFIKHVDEFGKKQTESNLDQIHEGVSSEIWFNHNGFIERAVALQTGDDVLKLFAQSLPDNFVFADLRKKPIKSGFAWGKFGPKSKIVRHGNELIWGLEKKQSRGLFSRIFGA
jgi:hypothetical protein